MHSQSALIRCVHKQFCGRRILAADHNVTHSIVAAERQLKHGPAPNETVAPHAGTCRNAAAWLFRSVKHAEPGLPRIC